MASASYDDRHHTNLVRIASSLCADVIFGMDKAENST